MNSLKLPKARGATGGFLGVPFARGYAEVSVLARGRTLEALRNRTRRLNQAGVRKTGSHFTAPSSLVRGVKSILGDFQIELRARKCYRISLTQTGNQSCTSHLNSQDK